MKLKIFAILTVAAVLLVPTAAHAGGPRFSFSLNLVDFLLPPPPPVYVCPPPPQYVYIQRYPVYIERQPVYVECHKVVKEHHYSCQCPDCYAQDISPQRPHRHGR
ncbi:MAG: hypothetical protein JJU12_00960 [Chlamydiales bacterium]|nr:hypothetical protein [Chlamydiales bacterium]